MKAGKERLACYRFSRGDCQSHTGAMADAIATFKERMDGYL